MLPRSTPSPRRPDSPAGTRWSVRTSRTSWPPAPSSPWTSGPHGETARDALRERLDDIAHWTADYLAARGVDRSGDMGRHPRRAAHPQPAGDRRPHLPRRLGVAAAGAHASATSATSRPTACGDADPSLVEMFDLEWRLDEVSQYADWFEAPHRDTADERVALDGLRHELTRPAPG